jgi:hypothetical protein
LYLSVGVLLAPCSFVCIEICAFEKVVCLQQV